MTRLDKPLRREILIKGKPYVLTISPGGMKLTEKGRRIGDELAWEDLVSGYAALAVALNASVEQMGRKVGARKKPAVTAEGREPSKRKQGKSARSTDAGTTKGSRRKGARPSGSVPR